MMTPDPAGLAAADLSNPQSLNRYAYALNNPLKFIDPLGLDCAYFTDKGDQIESIDQFSDPGECGGSGGYWVDGGITGFGFNDNGSLWLTGTNNGSDTTYAWYPGNSGNSDATDGLTYTPFDPTQFYNNYYIQVQQNANNQATSVPTPQQYIQAIANAAPTVCGGGVFAYAGAAGELHNGPLKGSEGFAGGLAEYDSNKGGSASFLIEAGGKKISGGYAVNKQGAQPLLFAPVAEAGGLVLFDSGVGVYGGLPWVGGGAYVNVTTNPNCATLRHR